MDRFAEKENFEEGIIVSALASEADIPDASTGFERRCLAALRSSRCGGEDMRRWRGFRYAASMAAAVLIAAWAATVAVKKEVEGDARPVDGCNTVCIEDVEALGVVSTHVPAAGAASISNESVVNANPCATALWKTLNAGQTQMAWEWPERAVSARLTITGSGIIAEKVYGKNDAFPVWNPPVPDDFCEDDVFTAKLTFYNGERGSGDEVACLVAEGIGFVRGVSGVGSCITFDGSAGFRVVKK